VRRQSGNLSAIWRLKVVGLWLKIRQLSSVVGAVRERQSERTFNHQSQQNSIMPALSSKSGLSERGIDCVCASRGHSCLSAPGHLVSVVFTGLGARTQSASTSAGARDL
jgi:hypothetical protein